MLIDSTEFTDEGETVCPFDFELPTEHEANRPANVHLRIHFLNLHPVLSLLICMRYSRGCECDITGSCCGVLG